jgi:hypothetical protein
MLLLGDEHGFLAGGLIAEPILQLAVAFFAGWRIERLVAAKAGIHLCDLLLRNAEPRGERLNLIEAKVNVSPHGVGGEAKTAIRLEALDRPDQANSALRHDFADRQPVPAVAHRDLYDEP